MKVRVLRDEWYGEKFLKDGDIYNARPAQNFGYYMVESLTGQWLSMRFDEIRFICPGVAVPNHE